MLRLEQTGVFINVSPDSNDTRVMLGPHDGLENNQMYVYAVTAINSFGVATSNQDRNICKLCI